MPRTNVNHRRGPVRLALVGVFAVSLIAGCGVVNVGAGPVVSEPRPAASFTRIEVGYGIELAVQVGPSASIEIEAQEGLLPLIKTDVDGTTLRIRGSEEFTFTSASAPRVVVTTPTLAGVTLGGGSQGQIDGLSNESFDIELGGGAGLTATGRSETVSVVGSGGSTAALRGLSTESVVVELSGGTQAEVSASRDVTGAVSGGARVDVTGEARVDVTASGGGEVHHD